MFPQVLAALGWQRFEWNNGMIVEYWKPVRQDGDFRNRIGVRFGEYANVPFTVYLWSKLGGYQLPNIHTVGQLLSLYRLISGN